MGAIASQITSLTIVCSIVYSDADQRKHQSSASLAFVRGIHRDRWIPRTNGQLRGKSSHLMTSSCIACSLTIGEWRKHLQLPGIDISTSHQVGIHITTVDICWHHFFKVKETPGRGDLNCRCVRHLGGRIITDSRQLLVTHGDLHRLGSSWNWRVEAKVWCWCPIDVDGRVFAIWIYSCTQHGWKSIWLVDRFWNPIVHLYEMWRFKM